MTIRAPAAGEVISSSQYLQPVAAELNKRAGPASDGGRPRPDAGTTQSGAVSGTLFGEQINTITIVRDDTGEVLTVAKPPSLRGNIATRINAAAELEEIFPAYFFGDQIVCMEVPATGVAGVIYADLNWDARRWTREIV